MSLRKNSLTYSQIISEVRREFGVNLSKSTVSDWVRSKHSPLGRVSYFRPVACPEFAYIIGVETGDGSLNVNQYNYRIRLKATDLDFVQEFNRCLSVVLRVPLHRVWFDRRKDEFHLDVSSYML